MDKGKQPRKYDGLTSRQRKLLGEIRKGKTYQQAGLSAYNTTNPANATAIVSRVLRKERFMEAMERSGLTAEVLADGIAEGITAMRQLIVNRQVEHYPDWFARIAFIRLVLKVQGVLDDHVEDTGETHEPLIIQSVKIQDNRSITINETGSADRSNERTPPVLEETTPRE